MCGIIGVLANRPAVPLMLEALKRLEYRGYDSAGVATLENGRIERRRAVGKLPALVALTQAEPLGGTIGVGHTRWATHGAATVANAHPHRAGPVAVVHNGIIENHRALREEVEAAGAKMTSETDTEVVAQLCGLEMARGLSPVDAAAATLARLRGAFALCFLFEGADDLLVCARRGSPLAIGHGDGEMFVGSDALALAPFTERISYLEDGDWAAVTRSGAHVFDADGLPVRRPVRNIAAEAMLADKGGKRHFMAKEIHEQPAVAAHILGAYLPSIPSEGIWTAAGAAAGLDWSAVSRIMLIGCGTAFYACQIARHWFETAARLPAEADVASEFRYRAPPLPRDALTIVVSQSGETADTLAALRYARERGSLTLAVVNVETSTMAREADLVLPILAGPEIGVASTKAFTGQLIALAAAVLLAARARGALDAEALEAHAEALRAVPDAMRDVLRHEEEFSTLAGELAALRNVLYIGRGLMHPLAMEGALKLKELTYIHAEGYPAGELKHGPIALIDEATPVVALAPRDDLFDKTVSNLQEVMARKGRVVLLADHAAVRELGGDVWRTASMPQIAPFAAPIVYAIAIQLIAYHAAIAKGTDVDQPRNLAKSVTVE